MSNIAKTLKRLFIVLVLFSAGPLLAQEAQPLTDSRASLFKLSLIVGGGIITLAVMAGAYCQSRAISSACEGISRNPGGAPAIRALLLFGLVLIETLVIYALFIVIVILMIQWGNY